MRKIKISHFVTGVTLLFITACISPSCASANQTKIAAQRKALMMQDKSDYSRNKRNYKGSKSHKKQVRRTKRYKKYKRR